MAVRYDWKDNETGVVIEHDHASEPPNLPGDWHRVFNFGVGRVEGAGGSKARPSVTKDG
jgi:hypothetical protein